MNPSFLKESQVFKNAVRLLPSSGSYVADLTLVGRQCFQGLCPGVPLRTVFVKGPLGSVGRDALCNNPKVAQYYERNASVPKCVVPLLPDLDEENETPACPSNSPQWFVVAKNMLQCTSVTELPQKTVEMLDGSFLSVVDFASDRKNVAAYVPVHVSSLPPAAAVPDTRFVVPVVPVQETTLLKVTLNKKKRKRANDVMKKDAKRTKTKESRDALAFLSLAAIQKEWDQFQKVSGRSIEQKAVQCI